MTMIYEHEIAMPEGDISLAFLERLCIEQIATLGFAAQARMLSSHRGPLATEEADKAAASLARAQGALSLHLLRLVKAAEARRPSGPQTPAQITVAKALAKITPHRASALLDAVAPGRARQPVETEADIGARTKQALDQINATLAEEIERYEINLAKLQRELGDDQPAPAQKSKSDKQFAEPPKSAPEEPWPDDLETKSAVSAQANVAALAVRRRRGAPPGNANAVRTGRRTARAVADRARIRHLVRDARATCALIRAALEQQSLSSRARPPHPVIPGEPAKPPRPGTQGPQAPASSPLGPSLRPG